MKLGFIGTGALTSAIVTGLKSGGDFSGSIIVSPRNAEIAAKLAARFPDVRVAADNQAVLDGSDTVVLAVRPQDAREVLSEIRFRADHKVVSLIATLSLEEIAALVAPATRITKALPMPMVAERRGPTIVFPHDREVAELFGRLGKVIEVDNVEEFDALSVVTATFASYFSTLDTIHAWLKNRGVDDAKGRDYIVATYKALAFAPDTMPEADFKHLAGDYQTRGGLNEQVVRELMEHSVFERFADSLDGVHRRLTGS